MNRDPGPAVSLPGTDGARRDARGLSREAAEPDGGLGLGPQHDLGGVLRYSHEAMATVFEVHVIHPDARYAAQAAQAAFDLVDGLENELSRFRANSDITRVNHLSAGERTRVRASTLECLMIARHMLDLTGGAFDVSLGTGLPSLELDPHDMSVGATTAGTRIDLGGIGKGYAVDLMAELLEEWGLTRVLVHGGFSSVLALDPPMERVGWPLTLSDPIAPSRVLVRLPARQLALGAAGVRKGDHIVQPRTGEPARGRLAAWVAVPRPEPNDARPQPGPRMAATAVTDALATACMLLSVDHIQALCARSPGVESWLLVEANDEATGDRTLLHVGGSAG